MPNQSCMTLKKIKNPKYETGLQNFPELCVTFLDENYYYVGVQTKPHSLFHPFVILRNINIGAFGIARNKDFIIKEIDCFDNRIISYENLLSGLTESILEDCFINSLSMEVGYINSWFISRKVLQENSTDKEVWASSDMPKELTIEYSNPCLIYSV